MRIVSGGLDVPFHPASSCFSCCIQIQRVQCRSKYTMNLCVCACVCARVCVCVWVCMLGRVWLFATPWTVAHQALLSMEFFKQDYRSGLPFPSPGQLPNPQTEPGSLTLKADSLPAEPTGKPTNPTISEVILFASFVRLHALVPKGYQGQSLQSVQYILSCVC